jgi:uncharacterized membrane protein YvlD (DUF360 family)
MNLAQKISGSNRIEWIEEKCREVFAISFIVGVIYIFLRDVVKIFPISSPAGLIIFFIGFFACILQCIFWMINELLYDGNSHKNGAPTVEDWDNENF